MCDMFSWAALYGERSSWIQYGPAKWEGVKEEKEEEKEEEEGGEAGKGEVKEKGRRRGQWQREWKRGVLRSKHEVLAFPLFS